MKHDIATFSDFPMPRPRDDAYYGEFMVAARAELEAAHYSFCDKSGTEYESGAWVSRYSNAGDYDASACPSRAAIFDCVFSRAIKSRAARLANRARA